MRQDIFGEKVHYEHIAPPFVMMALLNQIDNRYQSAADAEFGELTWKQMFFLHAITLYDEAPTIRDIADFMGSSHQNANKLCAKLLEGGYITAVQDAKDKRKQRLYLAEKGSNFLVRGHVGNSPSVIEIFKEISPEEVEVVIDVMDRLNERLKVWQRDHK